MSKIACTPLLFLLACLMAGTYGAIHNQISYTVSPEYFTQFKFHQFQIPDGIPHRIGAAIVGWNASWWMGLSVGIVLIPLGLLLIPRHKKFFFEMLRVFFVVILTVLVSGLAGLLFASVLLTPELASDVALDEYNLTDKVAFLRAGTMHNCSYMGGLLGVIVGGIAILRLRIMRPVPSGAKS